MKRYLVPVLILSICSGLLLQGDRLLERALDARLPGLLSRELGLPVTIEPVDARILSLTATTPRLVMGSGDHPAVIATNVSVSLDWPDLLLGEIRLVEGSASDLTLQMSNWPTNDDPWPTNYTFLDRWLPASLKLKKGRYIDREGDSYPVSDALWQRDSGGASVTWHQTRPGGDVQLAATLNSLSALLNLEPIELGLAISKPGQPDTDIDLQSRVSPAPQGGYRLAIDIQANGGSARIEAGNDESWQLPGFSSTTVDELRTERLLALFRAYREDNHSGDNKASLHKPLPALALPHHRGEISINEIWYRDELGKDTSFTFTSGPTGLLVSDLTSQGPRGTLTGTFAVESSDKGWAVSLDAAIKARDTNKTLAPEYLEADWIWQQGHTSVKGQGASWRDLLGSLAGAIELKGYHRGEADTPLAITARLDNSTADLRLDEVEVAVGNGRISGNAALTQGQRPLLTTKLRGEDLDLNFLFEEESDISAPGIKIPEYLGVLPGIDIDARITIAGVSAPAVRLAAATVTLHRFPDNGRLLVDAKGIHNGSVKLELVATAGQGDSRTVSLTSELDAIDLSELFQQDVGLHSRSTGAMTFSGSGVGLVSIFTSMQGTARLSTEFRHDNDWQRNARPEEKLDVAGKARLAIDGMQIVGIQLDDLDIESIEQDISGDLSMRVDSEPWLTADFEAQKLDVDGLLDLLPRTTAEADDNDLLTLLREFGTARLSLDAADLRWGEQAVSGLELAVNSGKDSFTIEKLNFKFQGSPLESGGGLTWEGQTARLKARASIRDFDLDRFLVPGGTFEHVPVSGNADIQSQGDSFSALLANVTGQLSLADTMTGPDVSEQLRRRVEIHARRVAGGMHAEVEQFQWGPNTLRGSLRYREGNRPHFDVTIDSGALELEPWEASGKPLQRGDKDKGGSMLATAAVTSARLLGNILRSPVRLFTGPGETEAGKKLFDENPLPFDSLKAYDAKVQGKLSRVTSLMGRAEDLEIDASVLSGAVSLEATAGSINGGPGDLLFTLDTTKSPAALSLSGNFDNIRSAVDKPTYSRSGFFSVTSVGNTSAQIAANLNGQLYLEFGKGPFDYVNFSIFTADMATQIARTLLPGVENKQAQLECGVVFGVFENGVGKTPLGYTLRTDKANMIGRMKIDLGKEQIELAVDSRSREGVGLAVGNVFSNTIRVKGPLTDPQIVPHTTGILWRGWAAFMTAGLSVVGESVLKRAMAAENPCKSIKQDLRELACGTEHPIAGSRLVCG